MRVKARALGLAEDYQNDKALEDGDLLYSGALQLPPRTSGAATASPWKAGRAARTRSTASVGLSCRSDDQPVCVLRGAGRAESVRRVTEIRDKTAVLKTLRTTATPKTPCGA